ncbi:unnamed protein product, partial [Brenthis ino]
MEDKRNDQINDSTLSEENRSTNDVCDEDFFIDDYSHLRLSYYQCRDFSCISDSSDVPDSKSNKESEDSVEDKRRKLCEYFVSQIPDLPHPSHIAASIIASASNKMDSASGFIYENSIEQGTKKNDEVLFDPSRRSTLNPNFK